MFITSLYSCLLLHFPYTSSWIGSGSSSSLYTFVVFESLYSIASHFGLSKGCFDSSWWFHSDCLFKRKIKKAFFGFAASNNYFNLRYFVKGCCPTISIFVNWTFDSRPFRNQSSDYRKCLSDLCFQIFKLCPFAFLVFSNRNRCRQLIILFETFVEVNCYQEIYSCSQSSFSAFDCHHFKVVLSFWRNWSCYQLLDFN
jgi:hypothetical protein